MKTTTITIHKFMKALGGQPLQNILLKPTGADRVAVTWCLAHIYMNFIHYTIPRKVFVAVVTVISEQVLVVNMQCIVVVFYKHFITVITLNLYS